MGLDTYLVVKNMAAVYYNDDMLASNMTYDLPCMWKYNNIYVTIPQIRLRL